MVCHTGYTALSILSWGHLCLVSATVAIIGFSIPESLPDCSYVYSKNQPQNLNNLNVRTLTVTFPQIQDPDVVVFNKTYPTLSSSEIGSLSIPAFGGLTDSKGITLTGNKSLLLSEPMVPLLTSSGTALPIIFDKGC